MEAGRRGKYGRGVGRTLQRHPRRHRAQIPVNLRVAQPEDGEEQEHLARAHRAVHLADELVVPGYVRWDLSVVRTC
jgi:hypothetical protein